MRAALISIEGQPHDAESGAVVALAGKSLARRQLDFALAAGAEQVIVLGGPAAPEAVELRHAAESAGAKILSIADGYGLLGAVRAADHLLVLAPGVLPEAPIALEMLGKGSSLLVLPAAQGVAAGFERIDLERAWAGAMVVQGGLVERLAELPRDIDPAPALLRIALQAKVAERRLPEALLAYGSWAMVRSRNEAAEAERAWMKRNLPETQRNRPARWLALLALRPMAVRLLEEGRSSAFLAVAAVGLLAGGIALSAMGWAIAAFVLAALGVFAGELSASLIRLAAGPLGLATRSRLLTAALSVAVDVSLAACAALAIEQDWLHRLFPPLALLGLLRALRPEAWPGPAALMGDRLLLALALALAVALGLLEAALMTLVLAVIGLEAARKTGKTRITAV